MNNKKKSTARYLARGGIIASLYVVLTSISALAGLSSGAIQLRLSEILCILPVFLPEAIPGLTIGCLIANMLTGGLAVIDIVFGTVATLIGAVGAYLLRRLSPRLIWLSTLPNIIANTLILPPVIIYAYGSEESYLFIAASILISQVVCVGFGGTALYHLIRRSGLHKLL